MHRKLVVRHHQPRRAATLWVLAALALIAGGYGLFELGRIDGGYRSIQTNQERAFLERQLEQAESTIVSLRQRVALLERSRDIDEEAYTDVRDQLAVQQREVQELQEELAFYKGIVSPADGRSGLRVQRLEIEPSPSGDAADFRLMLVQAVSHDRMVSGQARLTVHGTRDGTPASHDLAEISEGDPALAYSFRYFQELQGRMVLPEGFRPERVDVSLEPSDRGGEAVTRSFDWGDEISAVRAGGSDDVG